jgi:hypothetical protein
MTTSPKTYTPINPDLAGRNFSERELVYLEQRALNNFYDFVLLKFLEEQKNSDLTKAELARRIKRGPDQVNRWLASPSNWTIGTVQRLLAGISGDEIFLHTKPFADRSPQNMTVADLLSDDVSGTESNNAEIKDRSTGSASENENYGISIKQLVKAY